MVRRPEWIVLAVCLASLPPLQWGFDRIAGERATALTTLPPRQLLQTLSCGQGGTGADLLEVQATNYVLSTLEPGARMKGDELERFYAAIIALDPFDPDAVVRAAVFLATMADEADLAVRLLEDAVARIPPEHPRRWLLHWELVAIHITTLAHRDRDQRSSHIRIAGELLREISTLPGVASPDSYLTLGERLSTRGLSERDALESELGFWEAKTQSGEEAIRDQAARRLDEVRCALQRERLQAALDAFRTQVGRVPQTLHELRLDLTDPLEVGFYLQGERVTAPGLDARRLERNLVPRHRAWVQQHAGVPTSDDLGIVDVAPFLRVRLTQEAVRVEVSLTRPPGSSLD